MITDIIAFVCNALVVIRFLFEPNKTTIDWVVILYGVSMALTISRLLWLGG